MTQQYLAWMNSQAMHHCFQGNFDTTELTSGINYLQALLPCLITMLKQQSAFNYFRQQLMGDPLDEHNFLARTMVLNQDQIAKAVDAAVQEGISWVDLLWVETLELVKLTIEEMSEHARGMIATFVSVLAGPMATIVEEVLNTQKVFQVLVAMGAFENQGYVIIQKNGARKHFVNDVVRQLAKRSGLTGRKYGDVIRHYAELELRRLKIAGLELEAMDVKNWLVALDVHKIEQLQSLPPMERAKQLGQVLLSSTDAEGLAFDYWQGQVARGLENSKQALPFLIGVSSGILQTAEQDEAQRLFFSGVMGLTSTGLNVMEMGTTQYRWFSHIELFQSKRFLRILDIGARGLGAAAGGIGVL